MGDHQSHNHGWTGSIHSPANARLSQRCQLSRKNMDTRDARVFVTQDTRHNVAKAQVFGRLEVLFPGESQVVNLVSQPVVRALRQKLRDYDGRRDYILPVGDPAGIGIAIAVAAEMSAGFVRILRWDRNADCYFPCDVDLRDRPPA